MSRRKKPPVELLNPPVLNRDSKGWEGKRGPRSYQLPAEPGPVSERDQSVLADHLPETLGGKGMNSSELAAEYGLSPRTVWEILHKPGVRSLEERWRAYMFTRHEEMGEEALAALGHLLKEREPRVVIDFFRRMGVSREPTLTIEAETLTIEVPDEFKSIAETMKSAGDYPHHSLPGRTGADPLPGGQEGDAGADGDSGVNLGGASRAKRKED